LPDSFLHYGEMFNLHDLVGKTVLRLPNPSKFVCDCIHMSVPVISYTVTQ